MSALALQREILDCLGARDDVFAAEALKQKAAASPTRSKGSPRPDPMQPGGADAELLDPVEAAADELLSVLLPVVEYGGKAVIDTLPRALVHVAPLGCLLACGRRPFGWPRTRSAGA